MIAILVATPLQLFNSMMIMQHHYPYEKCDIFALDITCDMSAWINKLSPQSPVVNVYYMHDIWNHKSRVGVFWAHIHLTKMQRRILSAVKNKKYDVLLSTWVGMNSTWLFTKLRKKNPKMHVHFYEEGIGVYVSYIYEKYNGIRNMYKLLGYKFEEDYVENLYMYRPDMCIGANRKLKRVSIGFPTSVDVKKIFNMNLRVESYPGRVIYFDSNFEVAGMKGISEISLVENIFEGFDKSVISIRVHPHISTERTHIYRNHGFYEDLNYNIPWELMLCSNIIGEEKILVSPFSSAMLNPKMLYDKEPKIIMLGKAIKNDFNSEKWSSMFWSSNMQKLYDEIYNIYNHKERVKLPDSIAEASCILKKWLQDEN